MITLKNQDDKEFTLLEKIGSGGEARILSVQDEPDLVAKIYHATTERTEMKLKAMLANPPDQPSTHTAIAWPTDLLYQHGHLVGFLMPYVHNSDLIFNFYNPIQRKKLHPRFTWRYSHRTALNLVIAAEAIHLKGHVIGDVNESNFMVNEQALVTMVDTDSFQVIDNDGSTHRCLVGKPEYTPPELQGISFKKANRLMEHDNFGIAVLIFHLLMEGFHPFAGVLSTDKSVGRVDLYCIRQGLFPYHEDPGIKPSPNAPPFHVLHPYIQAALTRSFVEGHEDPSKRLSAKDWKWVLKEAERDLVVCDKKKRHVYSKHTDKCPWCIAEKTRRARQQKYMRKAKSKKVPTTTVRKKGTVSVFASAQANKGSFLSSQTSHDDLDFIERIQIHGDNIERFFDWLKPIFQALSWVGLTMLVSGIVTFGITTFVSGSTSLGGIIGLVVALLFGAITANWTGLIDW